MKFTYIFLLITFSLFLSSYAQKDFLHSPINDQPDGVSIQFIDLRKNSNNPVNLLNDYGIFINNMLKLRFESKDKKKLNSKYIYTPIPEYTQKLDSLVQLITPELIESLKTCCRENRCNDGLIYGYWINYKKGEEYWFASLDMDKITPELCGYPQLIEAIRIFEEIIIETNKKVKPKK